MKTIRFDREEAIGHIVLANSPSNFLDRRFCECLARAVHEASESDVRVVLVRAEGPNFSLGGDVREWSGKDINWFRTFVAGRFRSTRRGNDHQRSVLVRKRPHPSSTSKAIALI